jgi:hypothetical protein
VLLQDADQDGHEDDDQHDDEQGVDHGLLLCSGRTMALVWASWMAPQSRQRNQPQIRTPPGMVVRQ